MIRAFRNFSQKGGSEKQNLIDNAVLAIRNPALNIGQVLEVLESDNPVLEYQRIRQDINEERLVKFYQTIQRRDELTEEEQGFINRLGRQTNLNDAQLQSLSQLISKAIHNLEKAKRFRQTLEKNREALLNNGVRQVTLDDAVPAVSNMLEELGSAKTAYEIGTSIRRIEIKLSEVEETMSRQIRRHEAGLLIDQVYKDEIKGREGSLIRNGLITYLLREFQDKPLEPVLVTKRLNELRNLDPDLQSKVIDGLISRMSIALAMQRTRGDEKKTAPAQQPAIPKMPEQDQIDSVSPAEHTDETSVTPVISEEEKHLIDREAAERRRVLVNNEELSRAMVAFRRTLRGMDLLFNEVNPNNKVNLDELIKEIGRYRFGHPDIVRLIIEDYPDVRNRLTRLIEARNVQGEEDTHKDTRTGR